MANEYGQFDQGKGQKYAPKVKRKPREVSAPAPRAAAPAGPSEEDRLRSEARAQRKAVLQMRKAQFSDDHQ